MYIKLALGNFNILEKEGFLTIIPQKWVAASSITTQMIEDIFGIREAFELLTAKKSIGKIFIEESEKSRRLAKRFINPEEKIKSICQ